MNTSIHQPLPEGIQLGVYEIKEVLSIEAFSIRYRAWNHHLKQQLEIQEYYPEDFAIRASDGLRLEPKSLADTDNFNYGLKVFLDHSEMLLRVDHPNMVKTENVLQFNGTAYLIMNYVDGISLAQRVATSGAIQESELTLILRSILSCLQKLHDYNVVHGGIQPETVLLLKNGQPILTQYAGARRAFAPLTAKFRETLVTGYTAPECYESDLRLEPSTDFYALGATMNFCLTKNRPINAQSRIAALSRGEADPVGLLSDNTESMNNPILLQTIDWMLKPESRNRPHSVADILEKINAVSDPEQARQVKESMSEGGVFSFAKQPLLVSSIVGIAALIAFGSWYALKSVKNSAEKIDASSVPALSPVTPDNRTVASTEMDAPTVASTTTPSTTVPSEPTADVRQSENKVLEIEKKPAPTRQEVQQNSVNTANSKESQRQENASLPATKPSSPVEPTLESIAEEQAKVINPPENQPPVAKEAESLATSKNAKPTITQAKPENIAAMTSEPAVKPAADTTKASAFVNKATTKKQPRHLKQKASKPVFANSVNGYLAAARRAMKEVRFTTPAGDNAHHYYQMVLAKDPDNAEAHAGINRIVNRYAWFIRKTKSDGDIGKAKRVLKKAETVMPESPSIQKIREELEGNETNRIDH